MGGAGSCGSWERGSQGGDPAPTWPGCEAARQPAKRCGAPRPQWAVQRARVRRLIERTATSTVQRPSAILPWLPSPLTSRPLRPSAAASRRISRPSFPPSPNARFACGRSWRCCGGAGSISSSSCSRSPSAPPFPLPGLSTPFGLMIAYLGLRVSLGKRPWLPARLLNRRLPPRFFPRFLTAARHLLRWIEYFLRPRFLWLMRWGLVRRSLGGMICVAGLLLLLPLPIPFSNFLPAITVVLLAAALLENDGGVALAGSGAFLLTLAFFAAIFWGGKEVVDWLEGRFGGILDPDYETGPWP
ncbi:MAG: exopolysaccharide biosynthesis protein [Verrucomicrobia bacterium]|nr:exopolysaccharide biosynthesis protein [Verrucomicrobiota bacterium]